MIRGRRADTDKVFAAFTVRVQIAFPAEDIFTCHLTEGDHRAFKLLMFRVDYGIRAIRRNNASASPAGRQNSFVMLKRICRAFGRRDHFDIEPLEQCARLIRVRFQSRINRVVIGIRRGGAEALFHTKHIRKHMVEPHTRWRAAEEMIVAGEQAPSFTGIMFRNACFARHAEIIKIMPLTIKHAINVMVRRKEKLCRIAEIFVAGEP